MASEERLRDDFRESRGEWLVSAEGNFEEVKRVKARDVTVAPLLTSR